MLKMANRCIVAIILIIAVLFSQTAAVSAQVGSYTEILDKNATVSDYSGNDIVLPADSFDIAVTDVDGVRAVMSDADNRTLTATVTVPQSGYYIISVKYYPFEGSGLNLRRRILIDGKLPFDEASFLLYRRWRDTGRPIVNSVGDEVKPRAEQISCWIKQPITDSLGLYSSPLKFYIEQGTHTVTLEYLDQPAAIAELIFSSPETVSAYKEVSSGYSNTEIKGEYLWFEAEDPDFQIWRTESAAGISTDGDPDVSPAGVTSIKYNIFGGYTWRSGGQSACWQFEVKKSGYYKINVRTKQSFSGHLPVYRNIAIDGKPIFNELCEYKFPYSREWYSEVLGDGAGDYLFWFDEGVHNITMTPVMGELSAVYGELESALLELSTVVRRIVLITGQDPDPNYDYSIKKSIPNIAEDLSSVKKSVRTCIDKANSSAGRDTVLGNQLESVEKQLGEMIKDVEKIPRRLSDLNQSVISLGDWLASLQEGPLAIDYFEVAPADTEIDFSHSNFFEKIWATLKNFMNSFVKDYNALGDVSADTDKTISVWVGRGKDWAEILKNLCDLEFTSKTGVAVKMNIIPSGQLAAAGSVNPLLLAISAGNAPDVALGVASNMPVEYAIRGAAADLSDMKGFDSVTENILDQLLVPFRYSGGVYGLPETMYFRCMFYRKDIVDEYNIPLPDTWSDMYKNTLPRVYENGMQVYIPAWIDMFLLSNGGSFYTEDGLASALDTPEAYTAFEQYIETYTVYGAPTSANFFNRFRTGEMPIGLEGYSLYVQLLAAAPELSGRWGIMPIPAVKRPDGTLNRDNAGYVGEADIILAQSDKKEESWEFIKWWLDTYTQIEYGREIEGKLGAQARWATSNTVAFRSLPWNLDDLDIISGSWESVRETPVVAGSYFTGRHLTNAWNRCVINNMDPRESLELCVKDINKELKRRQAQFGIK